MKKPYYQIIKELREDNDLLQKEVAAILGIRCNVYQRYEYGERSLPIDKLVMLADYYHTSTDYILGRADKKTELSQQERALIETYRNSSDTRAAVNQLLRLEK